MAIRIKGWHLLAVFAIIFLLWYGGYIQFQVQQPTTQPPPTTELVSVTKPLKIALTDPLAGAAIPTATIQIYGADKVLRETLTTDSAGTVTTTLPYASDTTLNVKISKPGYVTKWVAVTVPKMTPADAQSLATNFVALQTVNLGTYVIRATDQFGNTYSSGETFNFTTLGVNTVTITFTIYNTETNSGYASSYDYLNNLNLNAVYLTSTTGSAVVVTGAGQSVVRGTTTYWMTPLSDEGLTRQLVGGVYVKPGVTSVTITFSKGTLAAGGSQSFTFNVNIYFDQSNFAAQGVGGPEATAVASFTLTAQA